VARPTASDRRRDTRGEHAVLDARPAGGEVRDKQSGQHGGFMNGALRRRLLFLALAAVSAGLGIAFGQAASEDAAPDEQELQWPRVVEGGGMTFTVYQPQIDKFADAMLEARAAVKIDTQVGEKTQTSYGVVWISAQTFIDKENELVELSDIQITKANFPTNPEKTEEYLAIMREATEKKRTVSLERIEMPFLSGTTLRRSTTARLRRSW
jgi:hypothetical protein